MNRILLLILALGLAVLPAAGCGSRKPQFCGKAIPEEIAPVPLSDVAANPGNYNGKIVVLAGRIGSECASACDFFVEDSGVRVHATAEPGFTPPGLAGRKVRIYGHVITQENVPTVIVLGIELI